MPDLRSNKARRVFVISDLHLGGEAQTMCSKPDVLSAFIRQLPSELHKDEKLEIVIAGDFVDFLSAKPYKAWTENPGEAVQKLRCIMFDSRFSEVFASLANFVSEGHYLTVLVGNHDIELVIPQVQDAFLQHIQADLHHVYFIDDGRAYRVGKALIEHGNRYDGANVNDWDGLREIGSALSRNEKPRVELHISAGSQIVEKVVSKIHDEYPFIDLIQPSGELTALLILAFEPALSWHIDKLAVLLKGWRRRTDNLNGHQPCYSRNIAYRNLEQEDLELENAFGELYKGLRNPSTHISFYDAARDWSKVLLTPQKNSLSSIIERNEAIPIDRLEQIRVAMSRILLDDQSQQLNGPPAQYGSAAEELVNSGKGNIQTVVMGHTHQARQFGESQRARYINTGTWADIVRVPNQVLKKGNYKELENFLRKLKAGQGRSILPTFADLRINIDGEVESACLRVFKV
jgi:UDP-2,3-diacylglucosamine pyrophosphatase LpxH